MAVGNENVPGGVPCHVRWPVESVSGTTCAWCATPACRTGTTGWGSSAGCPASAATFASRAFSGLGLRLDDADVDGFRLSAHYHQHAAFRTELHDLTGRLIDRPYVVLRVHTNTVRH